MDIGNPFEERLPAISTASLGICKFLYMWILSSGGEDVDESALKSQLVCNQDF